MDRSLFMDTHVGGGECDLLELDPPILEKKRRTSIRRTFLSLLMSATNTHTDTHTPRDKPTPTPNPHHTPHTPTQTHPHTRTHTHIHTYTPKHTLCLLRTSAVILCPACEAPASLILPMQKAGGDGSLRDTLSSRAFSSPDIPSIPLSIHQQRNTKENI